jgi:rhodanese-related sulfurtransferase/DNA-binding transcriptional ArsR family regulator
MVNRELRSHLYEQFSRMGKAISSPRRLELLEILAQGERTVDALARETALSVANASHHLLALKDAGLVEADKRGLHVYYRLVDHEVFDLVRLLRVLSERHLAAVDRIVRNHFVTRDSLEPVSREELLERAQTGTVLVLDVRPAEEFRSGHVPGAVSIPLAELQRRIGELPADVEIVAYCRGPYCLLAFEAVDVLRRRGLSARRLRDGFPEWRAAGLRVEISSPEGAQ